MNLQATIMKNIFRSLAVLLYFPPADKSAPPPTKKVENPAQTTTPTRNDRGTGDGPTQVIY